MKMRFKRFLSGFMAVATLASVIVQPVTVSASELEPETTSFEQQYPELQYVQDTLDEDEIVKAKDIEIPYGEEFEVEVECIKLSTSKSSVDTSRALAISTSASRLGRLIADSITLICFRVMLSCSPRASCVIPACFRAFEMRLPKAL